jgi:DNA-binding beta-propeller fold protein YncE
MNLKMRAAVAVLAITSLFSQISLAPAHSAETLENTYSVPGAESSVLSLDGTAVWVISYDSQALLKYSTSTFQLLKTIALGGSAFDLAMNPSGTKIYVALNGVAGVAVISTSTGTKTSTITTAASNSGVAFSIDGTWAYVSSGSNISKIAVANDSLTATVAITGASGLNDIKPSPDGNYLYLASGANSKIFKVQASDLSIVGTASSIATRYLAISPDGTIGYSFPYTGSSIIKFTTSNMTVNGATTGFSNPSQSSFTPDGQYIYVANSGAANVKKFRVSDSTIVSTLSGLQGTPWHSTVDPTGSYLFVSSSGNPGYFYQYKLDGGIVNLSISLPRIATYRESTTITVSASSSAGKVTFYANGKYISGCTKVQVNTGSASCTFKPSIHGAINISAIYVANSIQTKINSSLLVNARSNKR